ncbi:class II fructose-bisphosphate aldolase [Ruminococcaceae bacterium OttesenSCG-928-I18]|nr:class II fructose-bisphosphate aldolase [Ruminococcaceae bacterium OttesenSCG-928-I18]
MILVPFGYMLQQAAKGGYAIPAFNVVNMETIQAVVRAAELEKSPLIVQLFREDLQFAGADYMVAMTQVAAANSSMPVALSLDHGHNFEQAKLCVDSGFSGVMIDLSSDDFDTNVRATQEVVAYAHERGVSVEAELGTIFDADEPAEVRSSGMTDPEQAREFVLRTEVDALAISIGTAHGLYSSTPKIDFALAKTIVEKTPCPIVVHGGSNTPDDDIAELVRLGVSKINVGTDLVMAFNDGVIAAYEKNGRTAQLRDITREGRDALIEMARHKIQVFNRHRKV